jgi:hypothetical protein
MLSLAKENSELQEIKKRFSEFSKYFFNIRKNITIVYDKSTVYVIHKDYLKLIDLGKAYLITDLAYNYEKNVVVFLTIEGHLHAHFGSSKTQISIKKDFKKICLMDWIYSTPLTANFFVAEEGGIHFYRLEEEKKALKEVKHLSGKYHCYLYEPLTEFLVSFPYGDCDVAYIYYFDKDRAKNWFRCGEIEVNFTDDEVIADRIKRTKSFGLEGSRISKDIFCKNSTN